MAAPTKSGSGDLGASLPPVLEWAQAKDRVWITVVLENCPSPVCELKEKTFYFKGKGGTENLEHEVTIELFAEIDPEKSTRMTNERHTFFTLKKKDCSAPYWPRLTSEKKKVHFIRTDFNKWQDEDDSEQEMTDSFDLKEAMKSMSGLKGGDFKGLPDEDEHDSDDEDLPDLQ
ncbi:prostaglandin E synthase 3-like [Babylonia areolata]|uniref:prostaglandin E synthase 3-like n=1 Tax=Babylonia areolata TaxID=304850 RepID=UPI003FD101DD